MASHLYKETGRSYVEVPALPKSNTRPSTARSGEGQSKNLSFPSPYHPPANYDSFGSKPYKPPATTASAPRPGNNRPVTGDDDWVVVYVPPNPVQPGDRGKYVRLPRALTEGNVGGVAIPFP
jgi:hypothetical protein